MICQRKKEITFAGTTYSVNSKQPFLKSHSHSLWVTLYNMCNVCEGLEQLVIGLIYKVNMIKGCFLTMPESKNDIVIKSI